MDPQSYGSGSAQGLIPRLGEEGRLFPHEETLVRFCERNIAVAPEHQCRLRVAVLTRRGSGRTINQDRVVVGDMVVDSDQPTTAMFNVEPPSLVAVLDGLGGHPAGDIAAALAGEVIATVTTIQVNH